jgi:hypothetical protein
VLNSMQTLLQTWAANCLNVTSAQNTDPFQSLSDLLGMESDLANPSNSAGASRDRSLSPGHHGPLLNHYQRSLSSMVSCTGDSAPSAFSAFTQLANAQSTSKAGRGLHLSILAWAGRHMANEGEIRYEAMSEKLGQKATSIIVDRLEYYQKGGLQLEETERMTLLAGSLMVIQWKVSQVLTKCDRLLMRRYVVAMYGDLTEWSHMSSTWPIHSTLQAVQEQHLTLCLSACEYSQSYLCDQS